MKNFIAWVSKYWKSIVPGVTTIAYAIQAAIADASVSAEEWRNLGILVLTTFLTWLIPNRQPQPEPQPVVAPAPVPPAA